MKTFFTKLWWALKPLNKWHIAIYLVLIAFTIQNYITRPASNVISDFTQVEGVLTGLFDHQKVRAGGYGYSARITPFGEQTQISFKTRGNKKYQAWYNKPVVAYYWPKHGFSNQNSLIFMAPLEEKQAYLDDYNLYNGGFENVDNTRSLYWKDSFNTWLIFIFVWAIPFVTKLEKIRDEKIKRKEIQQRLEIEKMYEIEQRVDKEK